MSSGLRKLRLFRCAAATVPIDRASVRGECAEKTPRQVHFLSRSFSLSEAVAQNPPGECSHCRYLSIASGSNAVLGYIERHEQAAWVIYIISNKQILAKNAERSNHSFRRDPAIPTGSASSSDYTRSGFDRGHLAPAADMAYSEQTMRDSFYMSNISPQRPGFNRGIWKDLEAWVRQTAVKERLVVVVTGPVFPGRDIQTIGKNAVTVPSHFYKIVYDLTPPQKMIAFILPNEKSDKPLRAFAVSVDAVERLTGLDFFFKSISAGTE